MAAPDVMSTGGPVMNATGATPGRVLRRPRPAFVAWLGALLVLVVSGWVLLPFPRRPTGWEEIAWVIGFGAGFATMGALLVDRRPAEPVSRITFAIGLTVVAAVGLRALSVWLDARPGETPAVAVVAALSSVVLQTVAFLAAGSVLIVRFPSGRERGRLSDAVDTLVVLIAVASLLIALRPGPVEVDWLPRAVNPVGVAEIASVADALGAVALLAYVASLVLALVVLARRYRRSDAVTRAQIRWVLAAGAVPGTLLLLNPLLPTVTWLWSGWFLGTILMPIAIGVAILRYRLFEIDRIIGRTLTYGLVTAILALVFVLVNLVLQGLVAGATGGSTLVVAASTLVVAALFQPLRRRIQAPIDRRFNRARADADRVAASFGRRTRDEVDLGRLRGALVHTVHDAVAPSRAGLWLRGER
ncbi:MAG TPA: hypothetical protein VFY23_16075 [Candidatus Limnocylindrales bacterium]|nr:hypothetical protein [Candidatus Limnocylindrales bacterium]